MKYGYKRGLPDRRDFRAGFSGDPAQLPEAFSLQEYDSVVFDQGKLGSCTANAISGALKTWMTKNKYKWPYTPSRLQIYYGEREIEGSIDSDPGATIRDGFKVINSIGVCPEDEQSTWNWSYSDDGIKFKKKPPDACLKDAALHKCLVYAQVSQDKLSIQSAIAAGYPLVIGIVVYRSFEGDGPKTTGIVPMPGWFDYPVGGHALRATSYDAKYVSGPNSWGKGWGDSGYYHLPWDYILDPNLCSDIWSVGLIT